jgi:hypothetical protein
MVGEAAMTQARELMDFADKATDDPRRTRIDLVQVANYIARQARQDDQLRSLVASVSDFLGNQSISAETLNLAVETGKGWPAALKAVDPEPVSYFHAALRLLAHAALRHESIAKDFEARARDVAGWTARVRRMMDGWDAEWAEALTLTAAEMAAGSDEFRHRLVAAAWDLQQLVQGNEVPTWNDFTSGPTEPTWPPLNLGVYPILGGMDDQERFEGDGWKNGTSYVAAGGSVTTAAACFVGFGATGSNALIYVCVVAAVALLLLAAWILA